MTVADPDAPIPYLQRTRDWYLALGYGNPYRYAHFQEVPFHGLRKPLADSVVTLVTTAAPYQADKGPQGPGAPYNAAAKFFVPYSGDTSLDHDVRISHVAIDRVHTSMEDANAWFPLPLMRRQAADGRYLLAPRFHGAPTNRSQRHTMDVDIPLVLRRCREDGVDAALLVANCPVCHQTLSLTARALEAAGIATVILGCARDIVEHVGVPRFLFSDFPLGNAAGKPHDSGAQILTIDLAFELLAMAPVARTTIQSPLRWRADAAWKRDFCNIEHLSAGELEKLRAAHEDQRGIARAARTRPSGE